MTTTISGDDVVEVILNGVPAHRDELLRYGLSEEIIYYKRRWFVTADEAKSVLARVLRHRKPVKDLTAANSAGELAVA